MERLKMRRRPIRAQHTKTMKELQDELQKDVVNRDVLQEKMMKLEEVLKKLADIDEKILTQMLDDGVLQEPYNAECAKQEKYQDDSRAIRLVIEPMLAPQVAASEFHSVSTSPSKSRTFKLPKIEMRRFSGELKEWLSWWSQFQKIDQDDQLHASDKYQYLVQATVEGSRARRLVEGYPQTAANYPKVVDALKDRFGDPVLLTELYVRQLAKLVIANASRKSSTSLMTMFDELETNLRALESLGVTADQSAAFLYPLVESSLPEDLVTVWQRSPLSGYGDEQDTPVDKRLESLMKFLKQEVKGAERLSIVSSGIDGTSARGRRRSPQRSRSSVDDIPTAAGLFTGEKVICIFCDRHHESRDCGKANSMSFVDKKKKIEQKRACFICLRTGHGSKKCKSFVRCILCNKSHHTIMCSELHRIKDSTSKASVQANQGEAQSSLSAITCTPTVILQTLRIRIHGEKGSKVIRALVDSGSQHSYVLNSTAAEVGIQIHGQQKMVHTVFGGGCSDQRTHAVHEDVRLEPMTQGPCIKVRLLGQDTICGRIPQVSKGNLVSILKRKKIWLSDISPGPQQIEVLLGADVFNVLLKGHICNVTEDLVASETTLGWTITGRATHDGHSPMAALIVHTYMETTEISRLWDIEALGIKDSLEQKSQSKSDMELKESLVRSLKRKTDGRYIIALPWNDGFERPMNNKQVAVRRLESVTSKLRATGNYHAYSKIINDWVEEGLIELVGDEVRHAHYLPHRPVFKPESLTTPIRPVFDASCKTGRSASLNDCLQKGPNMLEMIPSILQRFRRHSIGVVSDIRKAYQMVELEEDDRNFQCFLWWNDQDELITYRHVRMVFGVKPSAFMLAAVIDSHLRNVPENDKEISRKLLQSLYVDNVVCSVDTAEELRRFQSTSVEIMQRAKMDLRQWEWTLGESTGVDLLTNSECGLGLSKGVPTDDCAANSTVLGIKWDKKKDTLSCDIFQSPPATKITKRFVLSMIAKVFDPLGFLCPALLTPKLVLQDSWSKQNGWDDEMETGLKTTITTWMDEVNHLSEVKIPRYAFQGANNSWSIQLHTFSDASKYAYGAMVFIRIEGVHGVTVQLLQAKSRVAPLKNPTIPRLELLGCLIGARLSRSITTDLSLEEIPHYFWTDSSVALAWIRRCDEWGTYVGNRVKEINSLSRQDEWRHVPGHLNPADLPSRGCSPLQLVQSQWWEGPTWLKNSIEHWPVENTCPDENLISKEKKKVGATTTLLSITTQWYSKYSSYQKLLRIIGWIRRFIPRYIQKFVRKSFYASTTKGNLSAEELNEAEITLLRIIQKEVFPNNADVIEGLRVIKGSDGIFRVKTKLFHRDDSPAFKSPVLLPSNHPIVIQLIRYEHQNHCHAGVSILMSKLRERVWIIKSRRTIKSVVRRCVTCRRHATKPISAPQAPLPLDRVKDAAPFEVTGVDLAGPLFLKSGDKAWIVIFTCAVFRCVHLELTPTLSTDGFIHALQKFINRRGRPTTLYSDNGTNFRGTDNAFSSLDWKSIEEYANVKRINWKFNPPSAAWWGGWWERLIRSVKDLLKRILGHRKLNYLDLELCLCEVETVLNSRPLTYVSDDGEDLVPLTPEMFLHPRISHFPEAAEHEGKSLRRAVKSLAQMREELRWRFRQEYLALLVHRKSEKGVSEVKVGDIVLIGSDNKKRIYWPMGRVEVLLTGSDGKSRVAKVRVNGGIMVRPLQRLYQLEVSAEEQLPITPEVIKCAVEQEPTSPEVITRSGRRIIKPQRYGVV